MGDFNYFYWSGIMFERGYPELSHKKYDEAMKSYTPDQIASAKARAKKYYIDNNGEASVKVLHRIARVPQGVVRAWMKEEVWTKLVKEDPEDKVQLTDRTKDILRSSAEEFGLNEQEELFCYNFLKNFNATTSAIKAGYSSSYAHNKAHMMLKDEKIKAFIQHIKEARNTELFLDSVRVIQEYIKIAFADMTDFVEFDADGVCLKDSRRVDGQLIMKVKEGRDGVSVELFDKMAALAKLERYLDVMPVDWRQKLEERKVKVMEDKLELDRQRTGGGPGDDEDGDDGFLSALMGTSAEVWNDEDEASSL
jgi:phage terminase small subunit